MRRVSFVTRKAAIELRTSFVHSLDPIFPGESGGVGCSGGIEASSEVIREEEGEEKALLTQQLYHQYFYRNVKTKW